MMYKLTNNLYHQSAISWPQYTMHFYLRGKRKPLKDYAEQGFQNFLSKIFAIPGVRVRVLPVQPDPEAGAVPVPHPALQLHPSSRTLKLSTEVHFCQV